MNRRTPFATLRRAAHPGPAARRGPAGASGIRAWRLRSSRRPVRAARSRTRPRRRRRETRLPSCSGAGAGNLRFECRQEIAEQRVAVAGRLPGGGGMKIAYSVSSPTRRWKTSGLFATVRHYRIAKIGFGLTLAVGADGRQGCAVTLGSSGRRRRGAVAELLVAGEGTGVGIHFRVTGREQKEAGPRRRSAGVNSS